MVMMAAGYVRVCARDRGCERMCVWLDCCCWLTTTRNLRRGLYSELVPVGARGWWLVGIGVWV